MRFLNVDLFGLSGKIHPVLSGVDTAREVEKLRPAIKMLAGDYLTFDRLARDSGGKVSPHCRVCPPLQVPGLLPPPDTLEHILTRCIVTEEARSRIFPEILTILHHIHPDKALLLNSCDSAV